METNRYKTEQEARQSNITGYYKYLYWLELEKCFTLSQLSPEQNILTYSAQYGLFYKYVGEVEQFVPKTNLNVPQGAKISIKQFLIN